MANEKAKARDIVNQLKDTEVFALPQLIAALRRVPKIETSVILDPTNEIAQELKQRFELIDAETDESQGKTNPIKLDVRYPGRMDADYVIGFGNDENFHEIAHGWFGDIIAAYDFFA